MTEVPLESGELRIDSENPWLGLLPFSEANRFHFFGRDAEISEIFQRISENTLTVIFGQSGLGKTSLLAAGVLPRLREKGLAPVLVRLRHDADAAPLTDQTRDALYEALGRSPEQDGRGGSLWGIMHRLPVLVPNDVPQPVLVFDQFEEIYTLGRLDRSREAAVEDWLEQIADLIQNRPPKSLVERFTGDRNLSREYDFGACPVHFVFALREDYLSHLEEWKGTLPLLVHNRMRLHALNGTQALDAVLGPASLGESPLVSRQVAAAIVRKVAKVEADAPLLEIRAVPPLLSLLCEQLNLARQAADLPQIDAEMVAARSDDILNRFYEDSFAAFGSSQCRAIRCFVEDKLVTRSGHRQSIARDDAEAELAESGVADAKEVIDALVRRRLLTADEQGRIQRIEITHDVLLPLVLRSRKERREREERENRERIQASQELRERQEREEMARRLKEESQRSRRLRMVVIGITALAVLATAGLVAAWFSNSRYRQTLGDLYGLQGGLWFEKAQISEDTKSYPGSLLFAAKAIGYNGYGLPSDSDDDYARFLRENPETTVFNQAQGWLADRPAYLPVWAGTLGGPVSGMDFDFSARYLAACGQSGQVMVWDLANGSSWPLLDEAKAGSLQDLSFDPSGEKIALAGAAGVKVIERAGGKVLEEKGGASTALAYNGAGDLLVIAGADGSLAIGDTAAPAMPPGAAPGPAHRLSSSVDTVVAACRGEGVKVLYLRAQAFAYNWPMVGLKNSQTTEELKVKPPKDPTAVAVTQDGTRVAVGTEDGLISIWTIDGTKRIIMSPMEQGHRAAVSDLAFRTDGQQLASASADGTVRIWEEEEIVTAQGQGKEKVLGLKVVLAGHVGEVVRVRYAPCGELLASAGIDGRVLIWDVRGKPRKGLDLIKYVDAGWFGFDGKRQLVAKNHGLGILNLPMESIIGRWQQAPGEALPLLLEKGEWSDLVPALITARDKGGKLGVELVPLLEDDMRRSAEAKDWNRFDLRWHQLGGLSATLPEDLAKLHETRVGFARKDAKFTNSENMNMIWCPPGTFMMGSPKDEYDRAKKGEAQCKVTLSDGFWMGSCEVTQAQWLSVMEANPSILKDHKDKTKVRPVENIDWFAAMEFCRRLTSRERMRGVIPLGWEYSLPTEAQWEYACRAGTLTAYYFGSDPAQLADHANYRDLSYSTGKLSFDPQKDSDLDHDDGFDSTAAVGSFDPNPWGLYDMLGNVAEWCLDYRDTENPGHLAEEGAPHERRDPYSGPTPGKLPSEPEKKTDRIIRGGSFSEKATFARSARGNATRALTTKREIGMRVVLVPIPPPDRDPDP